MISQKVKDCRVEVLADKYCYSAINMIIYNIFGVTFLPNEVKYFLQEPIY
jgi:hypothetical protein